MNLLNSMFADPYLEHVTDYRIHLHVIQKMVLKEFLVSVIININKKINKINGEIIGIGSELSLTDGRLHFNFSGDPCGNNKNNSLQLLLECDYSIDKSPLSILPKVYDLNQKNKIDDLKINFLKPI